MPRPSKFSKCEQAILRALRDGSTRTDAAQAVGIAYETLRVWLLDKLEFSAAATRAESDCANKMAASIHQAARPHLVRRTKTTSYPDGTVETETVETREFDWRAAESWLKRRRREEWGDNLSLSKMSDDDLIALATGGLSGDSAPAPDDPPGGGGQAGQQPL